MNLRPNTDYAEPAVDVLARNGRSFWLASLFLSKSQQYTAARLYAFCRWVDDAVDEAESPERARTAISEFRAELHQTVPPEACVQNYLELTKTHGLPKWAALDLLDGMESDLQNVRVRTLRGLPTVLLSSRWYRGGDDVWCPRRDASACHGTRHSPRASHANYQYLQRRFGRCANGSRLPACRCAETPRPHSRGYPWLESISGKNHAHCT